MNTFIRLAVVLTLISVGKVKAYKVQKRLSVLENRVNTLEMRVGMEAARVGQELMDVSDRLSALNATVQGLETDCGDCYPPASAHRSIENKETHSKQVDSLHGVEKRLMTAFKDEKTWVQKELSEIGKKVDEIDQNNAGKTGFVMQAIVPEKYELKGIVENITTELEELQHEVYSQIETKISDLSKRYTQSNGEQMALYKGVKQQLAYISDETSGELKRLTTRIQKFETTQRKTEDDFNKQVEALRSMIDAKFQRLYECPDHWSRYDLFCYHFFDVAVEFHKAREVCADIGAYVVDLQDRTEMKFVMDLVGTSNYWIGLTDSEREGTWKWDRTSSIASFLNWRPGQPDNRFGNNQDCVIAGWQHPRDQWNDQGCTHNHAFVCKKAL